MTTHVFIVNEETFPLHLKYMFAGTGAGDLSVDFNGSTDNNKVEKNLVSMLTDAARVRKDDKIIFIARELSEKVIFMVYLKQRIDVL